MGRKLTNLTGEIFGRLTVKAHSHVNNSRAHFWACKCDCGNKIKVCSSNLRHGNTQSCGCLKEEYRKYGDHAAGAKHNMSGTTFYRRWSRARERCSSKKKKYYYGRNIKVCKRWDSFEKFKEDMYKSFLEHVKIHGEKDTTIDRINVNGDYEPSNCRWLTIKGQCANKTNNKIITYKGESMIEAQWCERMGIPRGTISNRLRKGWDLETAFSPPFNKRV